MKKWNTGRTTALITFDYDGETLWEDSFGMTTPSPFSRGEFATNVGIPRILSALDEFDIKATFFVNGKTAERHPDMVESLFKAGHEIAHHGYSHTNPAQMTIEQEEAELVKGIEILEKITGEKPTGYRSPSWDLSNNSLGLLRKHGFEYDSSLMAYDFTPYEVAVAGDANPMVELPVAWELDDAPHFLFNVHPYVVGMSSPDKVYQIWKTEFDGADEEKGLYNLTMHPQFIGRYHRFVMFRDLVRYMAKKKAKFLTCREAAKAYQNG